MNVEERMRALQLAGIPIRYASISDAYEAGYVDPFGVRDSPNAYYGRTLQPYADFGAFARGEDRFDQSDTLHRSNFRRLSEDFGRKLISVGYSHVDSLGAFLSNIDDELLSVVVGLAVDYPLYDDEDDSNLRNEEITESWSQYLFWDVRGELSDELADKADAVGEAKLGDLFWEALSEADYYPEHNGLDVLWDMPRVVEIVSAILCR